MSMIFLGTNLLLRPCWRVQGCRNCTKPTEPAAIACKSVWFVCFTWKSMQNRFHFHFTFHTIIYNSTISSFSLYRVFPSKTPFNCSLCPPVDSIWSRTIVAKYQHLHWYKPSIFNQFQWQNQYLQLISSLTDLLGLLLGLRSAWTTDQYARVPYKHQGNPEGPGST